VCSSPRPETPSLSLEETILCFGPDQHRRERAAQALRALRQEEDLSLWGSREIVDFVVEAMYV